MRPLPLTQLTNIILKSQPYLISARLGGDKPLQVPVLKHYERDEHIPEH